MPARVFITRRMPSGGLAPEVLPQLFPLLTELRALAMRQPGYISGETLRNQEDRREYLVISTWKTVDDWNRWFHSEERARLQAKVDALLGTVAQYKIFIEE